MDNNIDLSKELIQLGRLASSGKNHDSVIFLKRLATKYKQSIPALHDELVKVLSKGSTESIVGARSAERLSPVDLDSRLSLLRIDYHPDIEVTPVWSDDIKETLEQVISEKSKEPELLNAGVDLTRTLLFTGLPGVGKSMAAKWLAQAMGMPLMVLDLSSVMSSLLGKTGSNLRRVFDFAKNEKCVLLLDELDAIAKKRDDVAEIGELKRLVTVILQEIDEWNSESLLVAATNHPDLLDPAIWRRFDLIVDFPLPGKEDVREAFVTYLKDAVVSREGLDLAVLASTGKSFSDIEKIVSRVKRKSIIDGTDLESELISYCAGAIDKMPKAAREKVVKILMNSGLSQRKVSELTGMSRVTIRKVAPLKEELL